MNKHFLSGLLLALLLQAPAFAETIRLNPNAPEKHIVVPGDTLWDISAKFLQDPWLWPEIWQVNPAIENPHLIYPGDIIYLTYGADGKPILRLERGSTKSAQNVVKLSPTARAKRLDSAIPTLPLDAIQPFLSRPRIITKEEYENAPYIVAIEDRHLIAGSGDKIFVRELPDSEAVDYHIIRLGKPYRLPGARKNEILGYEAIEVGSAKLAARGDPATLIVNSAKRETLEGDRLIPIDDREIVTSYFPRKPDSDVDALIIDVVDGVSRIGQFNVVVVNIGQSDGIEAGHVLDIFKSGATIVDRMSKQKRKEAVKLPDEKVGTMMIFRPFERVSYALVMSAQKDIRIHDRVRTP